MQKQVCKVTYRIYAQEKVKHKVPFFGTDIYPLYIRVTHGIKSLNFKSHLFEQLLKQKYQLCIRRDNKAPYVKSIIRQEEQLIEYIIVQHPHDFCLETFKKEYALFSQNVLDGMDEEFKNYLIKFLYDEGIQALAYLIENMTGKLTGDVILQDLKKSLSLPLYEKMMTNSISIAPPYIPLLEFCRIKYDRNIPVLLMYHFFDTQFKKELNAFLKMHYQDYIRSNPYLFIQEYIKKLSS